MSSAVVTFALPDDLREATVAALNEQGFEFEPAQTIRRTVLDTADGRLHRAGMVLELHESSEAVLFLSGKDTVQARCAVPSAPTFLADLPAGPMRARLALIGVRALLPVVTIGARCVEGELRDGSGKVVARVVTHERTREIASSPVVQPIVDTVEVREMTGYPRPAREVSRVLTRLGLTRLEGTAIDLAVGASGVERFGSVISATVTLDAATSAFEGFRAVLAHLAETVVANRQGTIDRVDPEFLHDLRIAVRRTRTVLANARGVLPPEVLQTARDNFTWLGSVTGPARDLDVYLLEWNAYVGSLGATIAERLEPVRSLLEQHSETAHLELDVQLRSERFDEVLGSWRTWLTHTPDGDIPQQAGRSLGLVVARRIDRAHRQLIERGRLIDDESPADQVHSLRKDAKKLRYLLECFAGLATEEQFRRVTKRLKPLQQTLGQHQDTEVHIVELRAIARTLQARGASTATLSAVTDLTDSLDALRIAARAEFDQRFAEFDTESTRRALHDALDDLQR